MVIGRFIGSMSVSILSRKIFVLPQCQIALIVCGASYPQCFAVFFLQKHDSLILCVALNYGYALDRLSPSFSLEAQHGPSYLLPS